MVKIRLKRMGTTKRPFYRLVVANSRSPRDGRFIEALGFYDPLPQPAAVRIDADRVREWLRRGARPSDSARDLLVAQGILAGNPRRERVGADEPAGAAAETSEKPAKPAAAAEPVVAAEPVADAEPAVDAEPVVEAEPVAEAEPAVEAEPVVAAEPVAEAEPAAVAADPEPAASAEPSPASEEPDGPAAAAAEETVPASEEA